MTTYTATTRAAVAATTQALAEQAKCSLQTARKRKIDTHTGGDCKCGESMAVYSQMTVKGQLYTAKAVICEHCKREAGR